MADLVITNVTISPTQDTLHIYNRFNGYVRDKSGIDINVTATVQDGSEITHYSATVDGFYASSTTNVITFSPLPTSGDLTVKITVMDSDGEKATYTTSINVLDYTPPAIEKFSCDRCLWNGTADDEGTYLKATIKYAMNGMQGRNDPSAIIKYAIESSGEWSTLNFVEGEYGYDGSYTSASQILDIDYAYDVQLVVTDYFCSVKANSTPPVPSAFTLMDINAGGKGLALGRVSNGPGFAVAMNAMFEKPVNFLETPSVNGAAMDYTVEQGVTNGWNYKKMASGTAELWGRFEYTADVDTKWGSIYMSSGRAMPETDYPFSFVGIPTAIVTPETSAGGFWLIATVGGSETHPPKYDVARASIMMDVNFVLNLHVIGKWK